MTTYDRLIQKGEIKKQTDMILAQFDQGISVSQLANTSKTEFNIIFKKAFSGLILDKNAYFCLKRK